MKRLAGLIIVWLIVAGLLVSAAVEEHSYRFYRHSRWICCLVFAYSAFAAHKNKRVLWVWVFGVLAALYNPISSFELLDRSTWIILNWLTVGVILIAIGFFWASETKITQQAAPKDGEVLSDGLTQAEEADLAQFQSTPWNQLTGSQGTRLAELNLRREQAKAKASERKHVIGLVIAVLVCFYGSIEVGMWDYKRYNKATELPQGKVVKLEEGENPGEPPQWANYKFKVNGVKYDGWVGNWDEPLSEGDQVQVYYNPANPDFNHAKGDPPEHGFFNWWTGFGIICLIALIWTVYEKRKKVTAFSF